MAFNALRVYVEEDASAAVEWGTSGWVSRTDGAYAALWR